MQSYQNQTISYGVLDKFSFFANGTWFISHTLIWRATLSSSGTMIWCTFHLYRYKLILFLGHHCGEVHSQEERNYLNAYYLVQKTNTLINGHSPAVHEKQVVNIHIF